MKLRVLAKTKSKHPGIKTLPDGSLEVRVREIPIEGKANEAIRNALSKYYSVPKTRIRLTSGSVSKHKTFVVEE